MMIDLTTPNEWQHKDESLGGILFPWYTKSFLDELVTWDLKDKVVFEYGCGASTLWWQEKAKEVFSVDSNPEWYDAVVFNVTNKNWVGQIWLRKAIEYITAIREAEKQFDIVVIDGILREECVPVALECLKPGGILIYDNWMQPSVEVQGEETQKLLLSLSHKIYKQEGHPDWQTAVFTKANVIDDIKITETSLLQNGEHGIGFTY